jgi:hypothetical protein
VSQTSRNSEDCQLKTANCAPTNPATFSAKLLSRRLVYIFKFEFLRRLASTITRGNSRSVVILTRAPSALHNGNFPLAKPCATMIELTVSIFFGFSFCRIV